MGGLVDWFLHVGVSRDVYILVAWWFGGIVVGWRGSCGLEMFQFGEGSFNGGIGLTICVGCQCEADSLSGEGRGVF